MSLADRYWAKLVDATYQLGRRDEEIAELRRQLLRAEEAVVELRAMNERGRDT